MCLKISNSFSRTSVVVRQIYEEGRFSLSIHVLTNHLIFILGIKTKLSFCNLNANIVKFIVSYRSHMVLKNQHFTTEYVKFSRQGTFRLIKSGLLLPRGFGMLFISRSVSYFC